MDDRSKFPRLKGAVRCDFSESCRARELPLELKQESLWIVQEAICNALKDAKPKCIQITLVYHPHNIEITVYDNGTGFDPQNSEWNRGFGLDGMEERARKWNGKFCLQSSKGHGARIKVMLPIGNNHE